MEIKKEFLFWGIISVLLTILLTVQKTPLVQAIYFLTSLLPIAISTSYFFNKYIVPRFLFTEKYGSFLLYTSYTIIASLYLETLMIFLSLILFSYFQIEGKNVLTIDIISLALIIYLSVIVRAFIYIFQNYRSQEHEINSLKEENAKNKKTFLTIKANRSSQQINLAELIYIESLGDQLKFVLTDREIINRDKISKTHELLPENFIRIHRSFVVNKEFITSFSAEKIIASTYTLPISRTYKQATKEVLQGAII